MRPVGRLEPWKWTFGERCLGTTMVSGIRYLQRLKTMTCFDWVKLVKQKQCVNYRQTVFILVGGEENLQS